jgi:hypothetical protein
MSLRRLTFGTSVCFLVLVVTVLFNISQHVQTIEERLDTVKTKIKKEQEKIRVLEAEWQYLIRPERLEKLALQYTLLRRSDGGQNIALNRVPVRPVETASLTAANKEGEKTASLEPKSRPPLQDIEDLHPEIAQRNENIRMVSPPKPLYKPGRSGIFLKQVSWRAQ